MATAKKNRLLHMTYGVVGIGERGEYVLVSPSDRVSGVVDGGWAEDVKESDVPSGSVVIDRTDAAEEAANA